MKHWVKQQNTILPAEPGKAELPLVSDISVARLIDSGLIALDREIRNLLMMSAKGKLDPASARDLRDHLKLLFELKDREADSLRGLTDEQLKAALAEKNEPSI